MADPGPIDLNKLIALARDKSAAARKRLVQIMGDLFFGNGTVLTLEERQLMLDILHQLIHDVEMSVRRALAERLAIEPDAPYELIRTLADDEIEVAFPVLIQSFVLHDVDLIEVIDNRTAEHQLAIASRVDISEAVSETLVRQGVENVIVKLLNNDSARISEATLSHLVNASRDVEAYQAPLIKRRNLPRHLAARMLGWVSEALREELLSRFDIDPGELDTAMDGAIADLMEDMDKKVSADSERSRLARELRQVRAITPSFMVQTLQRGEVLLFEHMFAEQTELLPRVVKRLLFEPGGEALAAICKAIGFGKSEFADVFMRVRTVRPGNAEIDPKEMPLVLAFFDGIGLETATSLLYRLQLDPNFLFSLQGAEKNGDSAESRRTGEAAAV